MVSKKTNLTLTAGVALALGAVALPAHAGVKWSLTSGSCSAGPAFTDQADYVASNQCNFSTSVGTAGDVTAMSWANTEISGANDQLETAQTNIFSGGIGVTHDDTGVSGAGDTTSPNHATDNEDRFDLVLFDFGTEDVALDEVQIGWYSNDTDISILRYTGSATSAPDLSGITYSATSEDLTSVGNGWELVGNFDVDAGGAYTDGNLSQSFNTDHALRSSYWIIGAYNPSFGSTCSVSGYCSTGTGAYDYVKIAALGGDVDVPPDPPGGVDVPEPLTAMLLAGGLAGVYRRRRPG